MLRRSPYGTHAAPARWDALCTRTLQGFRVARGIANAACLYDPEWAVRCVVRRGDLTFAGRG
eukprot:14149350-Alexandrium_andersonii.AAC.1